jgi:hypothetical protein
MSTAQSEPFDYGVVTLDVFPLQIVKELPALPDKFQEPSARMVILIMAFEVLGQICDSFTEKGYLYLGRAGIGRVHSEIIDNFLFFLWGHYHGCFPP